MGVGDIVQDTYLASLSESGYIHKASLALLITSVSLLAFATLNVLPQHTTTNRKALATKYLKNILRMSSRWKLAKTENGDGKGCNPSMKQRDRAMGIVSTSLEGCFDHIHKETMLHGLVCSPAVWAVFLALSSAHTYASTPWRPSAAVVSQHISFLLLSGVTQTNLSTNTVQVWDFIRLHHQDKNTGIEHVLTKSLSLCCFSSTSFIISVILCSFVSISCCCSSLCLNTFSICYRRNFLLSCEQVLLELLRSTFPSRL